MTLSIRLRRDPDQTIAELRAENKRLRDEVTEAKQLRRLLVRRIGVLTRSEIRLRAQIHELQEQAEHPLAVCEFCGQPVAGPLANCGSEQCQRMAAVLAYAVNEAAQTGEA